MNFLRRSAPGIKFDKRVLRKNDISLLTLDERWNSLFNTTPKTPEIIRLEEEIKEQLKDQARLTAEKNSIQAEKKKCMDSIIKLAPEAYENNNEAAKKEMQLCEKEIKRINERNGEIEKKLEEIPDLIKETNLKLLECTVNLVYFKISSSKKRVEELENLIAETRMRLKEYIDEKERLAQDDSDVYSYFHDLLGAEELERLDNEFFKA